MLINTAYSIYCTCTSKRPHSSICPPPSLAKLSLSAHPPSCIRPQLTSGHRNITAVFVKIQCKKNKFAIFYLPGCVLRHHCVRSLVVYTKNDDVTSTARNPGGSEYFEAIFTNFFSFSDLVGASTNVTKRPPSCIRPPPLFANFPA